MKGFLMHPMPAFIAVVKVLVFLVLAEVVYGGDRDINQDKAITILANSVSDLAAEVNKIKRDFTARPAQPRSSGSGSVQRGSPRENAVSAPTPTSTVDIGLRMAWLISQGYTDAEAAALANSPDRFGSPALKVVGGRAQDREVQTLQRLGEIEKAQRKTQFVLEQNLGKKKFKNLAGKYGFE